MSNTRDIVDFLLKGQPINSVHFGAKAKEIGYTDGTTHVHPYDKTKPQHVVNKEKGIDVKFFVRSNNEVAICDKDDESKLTIVPIRRT